MLVAFMLLSALSCEAGDWRWAVVVASRGLAALTRRRGWSDGDPAAGHLWRPEHAVPGVAALAFAFVLALDDPQLDGLRPPRPRRHGGG